MQRTEPAHCQAHRTPMDEHQLVRECIRGKPKAQQLLYERFAEVMMGVCFRYTKSVEDAEDVLQEGFIKVFRHIGQYREEGELGAWIRRIMVNTALNYLKKNKNYRQELFFTEEYLHPVTDENPSMFVESRELASLIRQLPAGYQTIFNLHAIEGYSHVEIGKMLGISDGTSRSQYARARNLLISWLQKYENKKPSKYAGK